MNLPKLLLGVWLLCGSASIATAAELSHSGGVLVFAQPPAHIVTYDLAVLDSLHALGVEVVGVPKSLYQGTLADFQDTPVVGTLFEPDYAALSALQPDLIFAGGRSQHAIPELQKLAPVATFRTRPGHFMETTRDNTLALAKAFDKETLAEQRLQKLEHNVAALQKRNRGKTGAFLFVINDQVMVHTAADRFGYAYELTGLTPAVTGSVMPTQRPEAGSAEAKALQAKRAEQLQRLVAADPDWLLVLDRGAINGGEETSAVTPVRCPRSGAVGAVATEPLVCGVRRGR